MLRFRLLLKGMRSVCHIEHAIAVNQFLTYVYFWLLVLTYSEGQFSQHCRLGVNLPSLRKEPFSWHGFVLYQLYMIIYYFHTNGNLEVPLVVHKNNSLL